MTKRIHANDFFQLSTRSVTDEGYLVAPGSTLARTGVQDYRAYELEMDGDPMKVVRLYRPADEIFKADSLRSFEGKPITIEHPSEAVTADNWAQYAKGDVREIKQAGDLMTGTLIVKSKDAIEAIDSGKVQLSNGYTFELDMTPGKSPLGHVYDGVQRNIRGNHVALVDAARCGSACRIADSQPKGATKMKVVVDGIPLEADETTAAAINKVVGERDAAVKATDALKATVKIGDQTFAVSDAAGITVAVDKLVADHNATVETLKKDVITPEARDAMVADWGKLIGDAKALVPDLDTTGKTCLAIRREVIGTMMGKDATAKAVGDAVLAGQKLEEIDMDKARAAFTAIAAAVKPVGDHRADDAVAKALSGDDSAAQGSQLSGRDKFMAQAADAWKTK